MNWKNPVQKGTGPALSAPSSAQKSWPPHWAPDTRSLAFVAGGGGQAAGKWLWSLMPLVTQAGTHTHTQPPNALSLSLCQAEPPLKCLRSHAILGYAGSSHSSQPEHARVQRCEMHPSHTLPVSGHLHCSLQSQRKLSGADSSDSFSKCPFLLSSLCPSSDANILHFLESAHPNTSTSGSAHCADVVTKPLASFGLLRRLSHVMISCREIT